MEAGFRVRNWCANHSKLLHGIGPEVNLNFGMSTNSQDHPGVGVMKEIRQLR